MGFALTEENILGGSLRLLFAFPAGLLLARIFRPVKVKGAFWIGGIAIVAISSVPRIGGGEHLWMNGIYDAVCAIVLFPAIVWLAASGRTTDRITTRVCKFWATSPIRSIWSTILSYTFIMRGSRTKN